MAATQWERNQVENIDKLLQKCKLRQLAFHRQQIHITVTQSKELVAQRLRYFATDLYSVLDYLCYLFYCHFNNDGNPSNSREARNVKFPYTSNLRRSTNQAQEAGLERLRNEFLSNQSNIIGFPEQMSNTYKTLILDCQVITQVGGDGTTLVDPQPEPRGDAKSFNALHYLRNNNVHRYLFHPHTEFGWLYFNKQDGSHKIEHGQIDDRGNDRNNWECYKVHPAYWIEILPVGKEDRFKPITVVAPDLLTFVESIRDQLLNLVFPGEFRNFDDSGRKDRVRFGCRDGLNIDKFHCSISDFDEQSLYESDLWAV